MFQNWLPYTKLSDDEKHTLPDDFQRPTWLIGKWHNNSIVQSRLSPIHWEPLKLQDIYRCPKALLECEKKFLDYRDKRFDEFRICQEQAENDKEVNWDNYNKLYGMSFMWYWRKQILTCRLQAAQKLFPLEYIRQRKLPLAQALHRRVKALGTCRLSVLNSELLQHIYLLSVDGA